MRFSHGMQTHRFTADDVTKMVQAGVLGEDTPVELIDGELIVMSPQGPRHAHTLLLLRIALSDVYGPLHVREEKPVRLSEHSLPEPDLAVTTLPGAAFTGQHPSGSDCLLVVEAAYSSQSTDRRKANLYSAGGVPEYWLVDIAEQTVSVYQKPTDEGYALVTVARPGETLALPGLDASVDVANLLP